jgi:hypothetical protein
VHVLKRECSPKSNLTGRETTALRELQDNKGIYIVPAATVILVSSDYSNKIKTFLADPTYEAINRCPMKWVEKQTKKLKSDLRFSQPSLNQETNRTVFHPSLNAETPDSERHQNTHLLQPSKNPQT